MNVALEKPKTACAVCMCPDARWVPEVAEVLCGPCERDPVVMAALKRTA